MKPIDDMPFSFSPDPSPKPKEKWTKILKELIESGKVFVDWTPTSEWASLLPLKSRSYPVGMFQIKFEHDDDPSLTNPEESVKMGDVQYTDFIPLSIDLPEGFDVEKIKAAWVEAWTEA